MFYPQRRKETQRKTSKHLYIDALQKLLLHEVFFMKSGCRYAFSHIQLLTVSDAFSLRYTTFKSSGCTSILVRPCQRCCEKVNMEVTGDISNSTVTSFIYM